jgi:purine or other phosphorylase family 1
MILFNYKYKNKSNKEKINMIFYSSEEGFIKPRGIKNNNGIRDTSIKLPHIAVGVFSEYLLKDIASKFECKKVGELTEKRPVYELKYKNAKITLFMAGISGPWISADIEELNINGVDTFIIFGNCGVLDKDIEDCSIIIPDKAYRDEGTSYHYLPDSEYIKLDETYKNLFKDILKEYNFNYNEGATWTIDAFYRETKEKIERYQKKGVICVEMEGASIGAVCQYKKLNYFTFYYAGDNLDSVEWEERSINQLANFNKKTKVPILALELAYKIENNKQKNNL